MEDSIVIIGGGVGAASCAIELRRSGFTSNIKVIAEEAYYPYYRPMLSKEITYKTGCPLPRKLLSQDIAREINIDMRINTTVSNLDLNGNIITTSDGESIGFAKLVLATGGRPKEPLKGAKYLNNIYYLHNYEDALRISSQITPKDDIGIIGGGFIGLEMGSILRGLGNSVTIFDTNQTVLSRLLSAEIAHKIQNYHMEHGVSFQLGANISDLSHTKNNQIEVVTTAGIHVFDKVLICAGLIPNTALASAAGLKTRNGILVDSSLMADRVGIFAIGDCAEFYCENLHRHVRVESVRNAVDQGKFVARYICGSRTTYEIDPLFSSKQFDMNIQIYGLPPLDSGAFEVRNGNNRGYCVVRIFEDYIVGVEAINDSRLFMTITGLIKNGISYSEFLNHLDFCGHEPERVNKN